MLMIPLSGCSAELCTNWILNASLILQVLQEELAAMSKG